MLREVYIVAGFVIFSAVFSSTPPARADASGNDAWRVGQVAGVQGVVHFEKRHTLVPFSYCETLARCPQSRPYWAIVLESDQIRYEIDQVFDEDADLEPDSIILSNVSIRSGSVLRLEGMVEYAGSNYYILGNPHNIATVMEY